MTKTPFRTFDPSADPSWDPSWLSPSIHPSYARILCSYIKNKDHNVEDLFVGQTLSWQNLIERNRFISFEQFRGLILNALMITAKPWLGVEIARLLQASVHGSLGFGAVTAPTVKDAFKLIEMAMPTRISLLEFEYQETPTGARFYVHELTELNELAHVIYPMLIGSFCDIVEKTTGEKANGVTVTLPYLSPPWFDTYSNQFPELRMVFGQPKFSVDIPASILETHSLTADDFAFRNAVRECKQLLEVKHKGGDIAEQIKTFLFTQSPPYPLQTEIAQDLGYSVRTLIRKLSAEGTSFQAILDEVKMELSCWQLQNTELPIEQIADSVGFIDTSNFSRVFKRWMGLTPSAYRKQRLGA